MFTGPSLATLLAQVQSVDVVEILKYGLSGLVFLFALLSFWLFYAEQRHDPPRPDMLRSIQIFGTINFVATLVVAAFGLLGGAAFQSTANTSAMPSGLDLRGFGYSCDYSTFFIDMSGWKRLLPGVDQHSVKVSPATFTRNDLLRKLTDSTDDYVLKPWTTGAGIDKELLRAPSGVELSFEKVSDADQRKTYNFVAPLGKQPRDSTWPISITFTIWNGFQQEDQEDWRADIEVPTRFVSFSIRFPKEKVVSEVKVFREGEDGVMSLSRDNPVLLSEDRDGENLATWSVVNIPGKHYVKFVWKWHEKALAANRAPT